MAVKPPEPVVKLTEEDKKILKGLTRDIERSEKAIGALKELDVDVRDMEDKLAYSKKARDVLLKEFG
uniref:Uncharacterized protein n=1 Tax=viral metagenome TaxID=1070528 RepID=A0A6H1ZMD7_9ZZZZ